MKYTSTTETISDLGQDTLLLRELTALLPNGLPGSWKPVPSPTGKGAAFHDGTEIRVIVQVEKTESQKVYHARVSRDDGAVPSEFDLEAVKSVFFEGADNLEVRTPAEQPHERILTRRL